MLVIWLILFIKFWKWILIVFFSFFVSAFSIYCLYLIVKSFFFFFLLLIKLVISLRNDVIFKKRFFNDLVFYRLFSYSFYETYSQLNLNYVYFPVFYFEDIRHLSYRIKNEQYYELLDELDTLDNSRDLDSIKKVVEDRLSVYEFAKYEEVFWNIFFFTNRETIYSFFREKDHLIFKHFKHIQERNALVFRFDELVESEWTFYWNDFSEDAISEYYDNVTRETHFSRDDELISVLQIPKKQLPVYRLRLLGLNSRDADLRQIYLTDYSLLLKKKKDIKRLLYNYYNYKSFISFLIYFRITLSAFFSHRKLNILRSGYFTFSNTLNSNFHFSNFLFFSHIYLQIWEDFEADIEESIIVDFYLDLLPYRYYLFVLFFFYFFFFFIFFYFFFFFFNGFVFICFLFFPFFCFFIFLFIFFFLSGLV